MNNTYEVHEVESAEGWPPVWDIEMRADGTQFWLRSVAGSELGTAIASAEAAGFKAV